MTKEVSLTKGKTALVDDEDYISVFSHNWYYAKCGYAARGVRGITGKKVIYMHRQIANTPKGMETDHINGNTLDNRKSNLRICSHANNHRNLGLSKSNASNYKGVSRYKEVGKRPWRSRIKFQYKDIHLGYFITAEEAARAYDDMAKRLFGKYARLNFPENGNF